MPSQQRNNYYSALLLNNIGVSLLQNGYNKPALATLKDALQAMNQIFRLRSPSDSTRKVQKAQKRMKISGLLDFPQVTEAPLSYREGRVVQQGETGASIGALSPVTIEIPENVLDFQVLGRDPDLEIAVMLSNLALSYHMLASSRAESPIVSVELTDNALHLCNMASSIVTSRFVMCETEDDESRVLSVALLVTGNTKHICNETGRVSDADNCDLKYQRINGVFQLSANSAIQSSA